jgi:hypothetical protein
MIFLARFAQAAPSCHHPLSSQPCIIQRRETIIPAHSTNNHFLSNFISTAVEIWRCCPFSFVKQTNLIVTRGEKVHKDVHFIWKVKAEAIAEEECRWAGR